MSKSEALKLTAIMEDYGILRIARFKSGGFSVAMEGDVLGTGPTVGAAFDNAIRERRIKSASMELAA